MLVTLKGTGLGIWQTLAGVLCKKKMLYALFDAQPPKNILDGKVMKCTSQLHLFKFVLLDLIANPLRHNKSRETTSL